MFSSFTSALSALKAHSAAVDIVGHNLANVNTTGYKAVEVAFKDLVAQSMGGGAEVGMGVAPLQLRDGASVESLGLTGEEEFSVDGLEALAGAWPVPDAVTVTADGRPFPVRLRIDTPTELDYFRHGGILPFVVRRLRG